MSGTSDYSAGTDLNTVFDLPLVRTGSGYDTVIHVSSSSSASTQASVTFYDDSGVASTPPGLQNVPLSIGGSIDIDAAQYVAAGFTGSAIVTASPNGVAVAVDVVNPSIASDSFDSYAGIPGSATTAWVPGAKAGTFLTFDTLIHVQNTTSSPAHIAVSFEGSPAKAIPLTIPPFGSIAPIDVGPISDLKTGWVGAAKIVSDQPVAALAETTSSSSPTGTATAVPAVLQSYGTAPMFTTLQASSVTVPHFVNAFPGWSTALMLQNSGNDATYTLTFANPDGSTAGTLTIPRSAGQSAIVGGLLGNLPSSVPQGFDGSVTIAVSPAGVPGR